MSAPTDGGRPYSFIPLRAVSSRKTKTAHRHYAGRAISVLRELDEDALAPPAQLRAALRAKLS